jgi:hypothetical protein
MLRDISLFGVFFSRLLHNPSYCDASSLAAFILWLHACGPSLISKVLFRLPTRRTDAPKVQIKPSEVAMKK